MLLCLFTLLSLSLSLSLAVYVWYACVCVCERINRSNIMLSTLFQAMLVWMIFAFLRCLDAEVSAR